MGKELTRKLQEIIYKCQAWIDDEKYIPQKYNSKSAGEEFAEKIRIALEHKMIEQKFSFRNEKIYLPTKYVVEINQTDSLEFTGIKREVLISELNNFVEKCFRLLSADYSYTDFIQISISADLEKGKINIRHFWEENYRPRIYFGDSFGLNKSDAMNDNDEKTIINPSFEYDELDETETLIGKNLKRLFCLEIWRDGIFKSYFPIFQPEISFGRGSETKKVDIILTNDLQISRHHAVLSYRNNLFNFTVTGQNPVLFGSRLIDKGQTISFNLGESFQIGSYRVLTKFD